MLLTNTVSVKFQVCPDKSKTKLDSSSLNFLMSLTKNMGNG